MDAFPAGAVFPTLLPLFGGDVFVCVFVCSPGAVLSTVCFSTVFLLINIFIGIMACELKEVLSINYTNMDSGII